LKHFLLQLGQLVLDLPVSFTLLQLQACLQLGKSRLFETRFLKVF
jgi:hypothetical protein